MRGVAVITGGSRGIGRAVCLQAAARGYDVVFGARTASFAVERLVTDIEDLGHTGAAVLGDLKEEETVAALVAAAVTAGPVSLLVNNAGVTNSSTFASMTRDAWDRTMTLNLTAAALLAQALAPHLSITRGSIVNISSSAAFTGSLHSVPYGVTKAGLIGLTRTLAGMLAPDVRVNAVCPGPITTDLLAESLDDELVDRVLSTTPLRRFGTADEVAATVLDVASWGYCTGQSVVLDGGRAMH